MTIRVAVIGANGRMGKEVVKMVLADQELQLVAAVSPSQAGIDAGQLVGAANTGVSVVASLQEAINTATVDVMVDFTVPHLAYEHAKVAIENGVRPIMGTTGYTPEQIVELDELCKQHELGGLIAPNFSVGAILMMKFAQEAAKYMPHVEIIEYHGDQKLDAPSGTSIKTAELIAQTRQELRQGNPEEKETIEGARGGYYEGFRIHSVRLPGVFAQQEVIFGGNGQTLKIRHDSYDRAGYMPGVNHAVKKVMGYTGLVYGFEHIMD